MRIKNAMMNSSSVVVQKLIEIILSFVFRTVLIRTLGTTYLGLSSLFTNIFTILSLMELGVGSSIVFLMYKPLNDKKYDELNSLLKVYSKFYTIVGILVAIIGVVLIPFLPFIIKEYNSLTINLVPIYIFTLLNVVSSYFLAYRRSLLEADQKAYINNINYSIFNIIGTLLRIVSLFIFKNYVLTLIITFICTILSNVVIYFKTNKIYPFLKNRKKKKLSKSKTKELIKRMMASTMHQIGNIIVTSTDNIIISAFIGVTIVGYYSNYTMMTGIIYSMFSLIFCSITANVGNMKLVESKEKSLDVYNRLFFLNFYLYFVSCTIFFSCINNFIVLWIGEEYLLGTDILFVITLSLYITGLRHVPVTFINSSGLNYNTRYKAIVEAVLNLVISLVLVKWLGIVGVVLGTIISFAVVSIWFEPYILYKHWFGKGLFKYYLKYFGYICLTVCVMFLLSYLVSLISSTSILWFILKAILSFVFVNLIIIMLFFRTDEFKYYIDLIKSLLSKIRKKA